MKTSKSSPATDPSEKGATASSSTSAYGLRIPEWALMILLLAAVMSVLFHKSFLPNQVLFANDGPLGSVVCEPNRMPSAIFGVWDNLHWLGSRQVGALWDFSNGVFMALGWPWGMPEGAIIFKKFFGPIALMVLGFSAWAFFRTLGFRSWICLLGGLAAALNMNMLSNTGWGLPTWAIAMAMTFLALAAAGSASGKYRILKWIMAGGAVGMSVMEGFDVGALFSLYVSAFLLYKEIVVEGRGSGVIRVARGLLPLVLVAVCAVFVSMQALKVLRDTQLKGVAVLEEGDPESAREKWIYITQWSLPKLETLRVAIPGLFGYRMDSPNGGNYWGTVGRHPLWETNPAYTSRFSGSGEYAGLLVLLGAAWAIAQALRKERGVLTPQERRWVLFWGILAGLSLLFAFGRFTPFYHIIYPLPLFSSMRSPIKFMHPFHLCIIVLFAYGLEAWMRKPGAVLPSSSGSWLQRMDAFSRKWIMGLAIVWVIGVIGFLIWMSAGSDLIGHWVKEGFSEDKARLMHSFSLREIGWFLALLALGAILWSTGRVMGGSLKWQRRLAWMAGLLLVVDLGRAAMPWIVHYDYTYKYDLNPVVDRLRKEDQKGRVTLLPLGVPDPVGKQKLELLSALYGIEWNQHHFLFYNIPSLDVIQDPRALYENDMFRSAFSRGDAVTMRRYWEMCSARYFLGLGGSFVEGVNQLLDPQNKRFKEILRFDVTQKAGAKSGEGLRPEDLTVQLQPQGACGLMEFEGALPRVGLYYHWTIQTNAWAIQTNASEALSYLTSPAFDPSREVLVNASPAFPKSPNKGSGTVKVVHYEPKKGQYTVKTDAPAVLLWTDRFDPAWEARVDGRSVDLLRCNYLMRGVFLEPGEHQVELRFKPENWPVYVSAVSQILVLICGGVVLLGRRREKVILP